MPLNGFTVGRDVTISIDTQTGPLVISLVTSFDSKQKNVTKNIKGLDGKTRTLKFPDGWAGSIEVERQDATLDNYIATEEANYYAGQDNPNITITETITEADGSITQFQFNEVSLTLSQGGTYKGDDSVKQTLEWEATQRIKLS